MTSVLTKIGPLAGFVAAIGYCLWPHIGAGPPPRAPESLLPTIEARWLKSTFDPPGPRDPFAKPSAEPGPVAATAQPAAQAKGPARGAAAARPREPGPPPRFVLGATMVNGARRSAIINGRVYRQGDPIKLTEGTGAWTLNLIEPHRVTLSEASRKKPVVLAFREAGAEPDGGPGAGKPPADVRSTMAGLDIPLPDAGLLGRLAEQAGGGIPKAYGSLLGLVLDLASGQRTGGDARPGREADR
jgi:hypothetical protein